MTRIRFTDVTTGSSQEANADLPIDAIPFGGSGATVRPKVLVGRSTTTVLLGPRNEVPPAISGSAVVGAVLSPIGYSWIGATSIIHNWFSDGSLVGTDSTYTVQSGDQGKTITYRQAASNGVTGGWVQATNILFIPSVALTVVLADEWDTYEDLVSTRRAFVRVNDTPTAGFAFVYWRSASLGPDNVALTTPEEFLFVTDHYEATSSVAADVGTPANRTPQYVRIAERSVADPTNTALWRWVSETKSFFASSTPTAPSISASQGTGAGEIIINLGTVADPAGRAVTRYEYRVDGAGAWTDLGGGLGVGPRSILGFNPFQSYVIEVRAVNANGSGALSGAVTVVAGNPPVLPPATTTIVFDLQQFTLGGEYTVVTHADGVRCIVSATPITINSKTPATISTVGAVRHGAVKNPIRLTTGSIRGTKHAFDTRMTALDATVLVSFPVTLSPGDVLVSAVSTPEGWTVSQRSGHVDSYDMIYVAAAAPNPLSIGPAAVGWSGRSSLPVPAPVDYMAKAALLPVTYTAPGYTYWTEAQVERALRFNPAYAYSTATSNTGSATSSGITRLGQPGYQGMFPHAWAEYRRYTLATGHANYGYLLGTKIDTLMWYLLAPLDKVSLALKAKILMRFHSFAYQTQTSWDGGGITPGPDGTHNFTNQGPFALMYWMTGDTAGLTNLRSAHGANWNQYFTLTAAEVPSFFEPWGDPDDFNSMASSNKPATMFRRRILSINEAAKTITYKPLSQYLAGGAYGASTKQRLSGLRLTRESDGVSARILGEGGDSTSGTSDLTIKTMTLDSWPTPGLQVGDVFTCNCPWPRNIGDVDWRITTGPNKYNPAASMAYRQDQVTFSHLAVLRVLGIHQPDWQEIWEYNLLAIEPDFPTALDNWPLNQYASTSFFKKMWDAYKTTILAVPQPDLL